MELTIEQALQQGVAAHKEGKLQDAEKLYRAILQSEPLHPDANHNLGVLAVSVDKTDAALPFFKTALEANPKIEQFWLSYIDALIKEQQFENSKQVLEQGRKFGLVGDKVDAFETQVKQITQSALPKSPEKKKSLTLKEKRKEVQLAPQDAVAHYNLGNTLKELQRFDEAAASYTKSIALKPDFAEAHCNLGSTLQRQGKFDQAEASYNQAIALKPDFAEAHCNLGNTLKELQRLDEAEASYTKSIALKPDFAIAYWNLHGIQKTIEKAEQWIDKCLIADPNYLKAKLTKVALKFYRGDRADFDNLTQSELKQNPYMRSFSWAFSFSSLPELHFYKFYFFDAIIKKSITSRPFYEFGVWRGSSFEYLIKVFKKGYGFDTFTGLPKEWDVGRRIEKRGAYTSDGNVPKIKGGEFIVGKFEDTLPIFFSESRPMASIINFDADLYSSTICALSFSKSVMDKDTILIFDELIINESWEQDEFKALNEFCSINNLSYEVIAVSFFTKQVAVKLIGI